MMKRLYILLVLMFTGLVQAQGSVSLISPTQLQVTLVQHREAIATGLALGDSIAVDGVCLTVERILPGGFIATISPETIRRTCLGARVEAQMPVNLEPSLRVGGKVGGHFVTGHVDGVGSLGAIQATDNAWELAFSPSGAQLHQWQTAIAPYIAPKGSITVNGISLTVAACDRAGTTFTVAVIPHTYYETNLSQLRSGDTVNLEGDILSKYVEQLLHRSSAPTTDLDLSFLAEHGYV